jgi:hypothetical protein
MFEQLGQTHAALQAATSGTLIVWLLASTPHSTVQQSVDQATRTFRAGVETVAVSASVRDSHGHLVTTLGRDDIVDAMHRCFKVRLSLGETGTGIQPLEILARPGTLHLRAPK